MSVTLRQCTDALLPHSSVHVHAVHPLVLHKKAKQFETSYSCYITSVSQISRWLVVGLLFEHSQSKKVCESRMFHLKSLHQLKHNWSEEWQVHCYINENNNSNESLREELDRKLEQECQRLLRLMSYVQSRCVYLVCILDSLTHDKMYQAVTQSLQIRLLFRCVWRSCRYQQMVPLLMLSRSLLTNVWVIRNFSLSQAVPNNWPKEQTG